MAETDYIGEVIESSTMEFTAESRELQSPPPFGSFVKIACKGQNTLQTNTVQVTNKPSSSEDEDDPFMNPFRRVAGTFGADYRTTVDHDHASVEPAEAPSPAIYAIVYQATTAPVD